MCGLACNCKPVGPPAWAPTVAHSDPLAFLATGVLGFKGYALFVRLNSMMLPWCAGACKQRTPWRATSQALRQWTARSSPQPWRWYALAHTPCLRFSRVFRLSCTVPVHMCPIAARAFSLLSTHCCALLAGVGATHVARALRDRWPCGLWSHNHRPRHLVLEVQGACGTRGPRLLALCRAVGKLLPCSSCALHHLHHFPRTHVPAGVKQRKLGFQS